MEPVHSRGFRGTTERHLSQKEIRHRRIRATIRVQRQRNRKGMSNLGSARSHLGGEIPLRPLITLRRNSSHIHLLTRNSAIVNRPRLQLSTHRQCGLGRDTKGNRRTAEKSNLQTRIHRGGHRHKRKLSAHKIYR
jgi:hypothetical protein